MRERARERERERERELPGGRRRPPYTLDPDLQPKRPLCLLPSRGGMFVNAPMISFIHSGTLGDALL